MNLTTEDSLGQLDAYVQNGEWDLEGQRDGLVCFCLHLRLSMHSVRRRSTGSRLRMLPNGVSLHSVYHSNSSSNALLRGERCW